MSERRIHRRRIVVQSDSSADDDNANAGDETVESTPAESQQEQQQQSPTTATRSTRKRTHPAQSQQQQASGSAPTPSTRTSKRARNDETAAATTTVSAEAAEADAEQADDVEMTGDAAGPSTSLTQPVSRAAWMDFDPSQRSGKIVRIVLKNFMCHTNLAVDLNNRINLMIGHNGSGKSAILTALVIGMGSKATATSRSSNMAQLIKRGESCATVEIHLENHAHDGYELEKYGRRIVVQRSVYSTGRSVYKLKAASGAIVSTKRDDLLRMIMYLNIQVDNPVCVLNQDAARSFLRE